MAIEDRSLAWRWGQSWYLLLTLPFGTTSWMAFLYMGMRVRRWGWILWGVVYLAVLVRLLLYSNAAGPNATPADEHARGTAVLLLWLVALVHALLSRKAFLRALDASQGSARPYAAPADPPRTYPASADPYAADTTPTPVQNDFAIFASPAAAPAQRAPVPPPVPRAPATPPPVPQAAPATPPPLPNAGSPPPLPEESAPPPPPFSGPAPFGGPRPFGDGDNRRQPPAPPPPPRRPGRQAND